MDAIISAQAAALALIEGSDCYLVHASEPGRQLKVGYGSLKYVFSGIPDVQYFSHISRADAHKTFLSEVKADEALRLVLILCDEKEDIDVRGEAAGEVEKLLIDAEVRRFVESVLYSNPVPKTFSFDHESVERFPSVKDVVRHLAESQDSISRTTKAWEELPDSLFEDENMRSSFRAQATKRGVFYLLANAVAKDSKAVNIALVEAFTRLKHLPNHRAVITHWTKDFKAKSQDFGMAVKLASIKETEEAEKAKRLGTGKALDGHAAFQNVLNQQEAILHQIRLGNVRLARTYMEQLVEGQLRTEQSELAAKTLCKMAQEANAYGQYSLQLEWAKRASELSPLDAIAYGHLADAYISLNRFDEALHALRRTEELGDPRFSNTERARVLRLQGRLDEALAAYKKLISEYGSDPENSYAWKGCAEVLRDMWHLDDALSAYEDSVKHYPDDEISLCGKAAVLADLGRFQESKDTFDVVLERKSNSDSALNGKARVLKFEGAFPEALALLESSISKYPGKPHGVIGKANVLREMRMFDDAMMLLRRARRDFPYEPLVMIEMGELLRDQHNLNDALAVYNNALQDFPSYSRVGSGRANILKELGDLKEALRAYDQNIGRFPYDVTSHYGRSDVLKRLRAFNDALAAYDDILLRWPERGSEVRHRKAAILVALDRYSEAEALLPTTLPRTADEWVASHVRGMILLKTSRLKEAVAHFKKGLESVPYARQRKYFQNALAVALLRQEEFLKASQVLPEANEAVTNVLQLHAWAGEGREGEALRMLRVVEQTATAQIIELGLEIARRFKIKSERPRYDENWIHGAECELVLLEAA